MTEAAVIIVGAGPVGLTAALALARHGVRVTVLEAGATLSRESRASTFHPPTLEMLDDLGVADALIDRGFVAPTMQYRDRSEGLVAELDLSVLRNDTRFPFRLQCEQRLLAEILLERVQANEGVDVRFGERVVAARTDGDRALVTVAAGSEPRELAAPWVIAADGAHSAVRGSLRIAFEGKTYPGRYLVLTLDAALDSEMPGIAPVNYISDPETWCAVLRTHDRWRVLLPVDENEDDSGATATSRVQERLGMLGPRIAQLAVEHVTLYRVHQRVAERFREGRVLLEGDAAHINNPLGGMGMNSGIHDAWLTANPLAELCRGASDEAPLDGLLVRRRQACLEHVLAQSDRNASTISERDPAQRRRRHDRLRAIARDRESMREYLLTTSMLAAVRDEPLAERLRMQTRNGR